ncbi:DUF6225 family protein [Streptosporangium sp. NPDC051022]|uniref:DUF6225 family protein n=1 Tax=Streptosporangium sp. NPDC051022 TaxID=3155752 RepID=UPI003422A867
MGWHMDGPSGEGHEGWDATVFPGERISVGSGGGGALVRRPDGTLEEGVDGRTAIGWRGACECGWRGPLWVRVHSPQEQNTTDRRIWWDDINRYGDTPADVEEAILAEWRGHLEPPALADVRAAARAADAATARLTAAVRAARAERRSWADIGSAVGITRQSAHERWARVAQADPAQLICAEPYPLAPGRRCILPLGHPDGHQSATGIDWPAETVARTRAVPWERVADDKGRRAWTAGQLRAALADLDDDAPVIVHVATDEADVADDQIITSAGHGQIGWGDGHGKDPDPIFALEAHWPATTTLHIKPRR